MVRSRPWRPGWWTPRPRGSRARLRALPTELTGEGWPERLLDELAALHLLVQAHRRLDHLDPDLAATVRSRVGYPVAKDRVLARPGVVDRWSALGQVDLVEHRLETRRVWLYGTRTGRWAVLLSFAPPGGLLSSEVVAGDQLSATLHFYPGAGQLRALVGERADLAGDPVVPAAASWAEVQQRFAELLAADPWASRMPAAVAVTPIPARGDEPWRLRDRAGAVVDVVGLPDAPWLLLACSAGDLVGVFGEWSPGGFQPLSVLPDGHGLPFCSPVVARAA